MNFDRIDLEKTNRYFQGVSFKGPVWMIIIGVIFSILGFALTRVKGGWVILGLIGLLLIAGAIALIVAISKKKVSDEEYEAEIKKMFEGLHERALEKLGVDEDEVREIAPISFDGYRYYNGALMKEGSDNLWRSNAYEACKIFFSDNEVYLYYIRFLTTERSVSESTDIYFYRDIVSASTSSESYRMNDSKTINYESFRLTTAGGNALSVNVRDIDSAQRSINAMRALLIIKKRA